MPDGDQLCRPIDRVMEKRHKSPQPSHRRSIATPGAPTSPDPPRQVTQAEARRGEARPGDCASKILADGQPVVNVLWAPARPSSSLLASTQRRCTGLHRDSRGAKGGGEGWRVRGTLATGS